MNAHNGRRLVFAFLLAALLGIAAAKMKAQDRQPIYYPGICAVLEPYGYWWYFWDCFNWTVGTVETVTVTETERERVTHVERIHPDGSRRVIVRRQPKER